jgi:hypothetical protein
MTVHRSIAGPMAIVVIMVASCGQTTVPSTAVKGTHQAPPAGGAAPGAESPFGRRDLPPAGVAEFLFFEAGGAGDDPIVSGLGSISPRSVRIGETAQLVVAGGSSDGLMSVHLYQFTVDPAGGSGFRFIADIGPIRLDANGGGRMELSPRQGDAPGAYGVIVLPVGGVAPRATRSPTIHGTADDYLALASSAGLTCRGAGSGQIPGAAATECHGLLDGADIQLNFVAGDGGALHEVFATATGRPEAATPLFAELARVATGDPAAARWVGSFSPAPEPFRGEFGGIEVEMFEEFDGGLTLFIGPPWPSGLPPDGWVGFDVRP